ncbi:MAG: Holliday junction resolvase RuvX [Chloroflexi bacterium]|nr:Holliday junction resolvase RuvX [Chloroflexota bacterium]
MRDPEAASPLDHVRWPDYNVVAAPLGADDGTSKAIGEMGRILGLDVGERRIGVAISDPDGRLAVPLCIIDREGGSDTERIRDIARREGATMLVSGHPLSLAGAAGAQARRAEAFARRAAAACGLPLALQDERLSSVQAQRAGPGRDRRRSKSGSGSRRRAPVDDRAAAIILQSYLDRQRLTESFTTL